MFKAVAIQVVSPDGREVLLPYTPEAESTLSPFRKRGYTVTLLCAMQEPAPVQLTAFNVDDVMYATFNIGSVWIPRMVGVTATHLPTGWTVSCSTHKHQSLQNRAVALSRLQQVVEGYIAGKSPHPMPEGLVVSTPRGRATVLAGSDNPNEVWVELDTGVTMWFSPENVTLPPLTNLKNPV